MKIPFLTIYKIELYKLFKRKDWLALLALVGIGILFAAALLSDGYKGTESQSALFWIVTQMYNSSVLMVTPIVFAFISSRTLASEIENGSILLYTSKYRSRGRLYMAKSCAVLTFSVLTFAAMASINLFTYYTIAVRNPVYASGRLLGENTALLVMLMTALYFSSFFLVSQFALFLSAFFQPTPVIGISFAVILVLHNTFKVPFFQKLNPWYYVAWIGNDTASTAQALNSNIPGMLAFLAAFLVLAFIYAILFNLIGIKKFEHMDL